MTFPVVQSVLDTSALAKAAAALYPLASPVRCRLISRGMNDIYRLSAGPQVFALKVARTERTDAAFAYEPAFIAHLDKIGFAVPTPLATRDGQPFFSVDAPEGPRQIMLTRWFSGTLFGKDMYEEQARQLGAWLARIHQAGASFRPAASRPAAADRQVGQDSGALIDMVAEADMGAFLERAVVNVRARIAALDPRAVPRGPCHGDFQYTNVMVLADRSLAVLDFSDCGEDFLISDLASFFWRADFDGVGDVLNTACVAGYGAIRRLTPGEQAALPLLRAARHLALASALARQSNRTGPVPGFESNLRYYLSMIRLYCAQAGIT